MFTTRNTSYVSVEIFMRFVADKAKIWWSQEGSSFFLKHGTYYAIFSFSKKITYESTASQWLPFLATGAAVYQRNVTVIGDSMRKTTGQRARAVSKLRLQLPGWWQWVTAGVASRVNILSASYATDSLPPVVRRNVSLWHQFVLAMTSVWATITGCRCCCIIPSQNAHTERSEDSSFEASRSK